ncbi:MAG: acyl-CoA dehydrogenase family protein, partial [Anaerolineales bacterium]|nr:acyl-CoA dehydrogenase family protein [Anaerolineales bacterium]
MIPLTDELKRVLSTIREIVREELIPLEPDFLHKGFYAMEPVLNEKRAMVKKLGFWLPQVPAEYGGMGLSLFEHGLVSQELGQSL